MLSRITIRNLVIVKSLDLALESGMTTLTGETGAGKSILVDALGLALGDKADIGLIRDGADRAEVSVAFDLAAQPAVLAWLDERDLSDETQCLIRRVLNRNGRGRAYVNGSPTPLATVRELGEQLVDIHGQHAHQSLLRSATQRQLLDDWGGLRDAVEATSSDYAAWRRVQAEHEALAAATRDRATRLDYLRFQLQELDDLPCAPGEIAALEAEHARLAHAERLLGDAGQVLNALTEDDSPLRATLNGASRTLDTLAEIDPTLAEARGLVAGAEIQIDETVSILRRYLDGIEMDPARLAEIDEQLSRLHGAARKHGVTPDALEALREALRSEAAALDDADDSLQRLAAERDAAEKAYRTSADALSAARQAAADGLTQTVTASLQTLGMQGGRFAVKVTPDRAQAGATGIDRVCFEVAANPGQRPGALADVASGGELSRISLAIQVATANCARVPTLIFDEVDVGIGGATAEIVGQLLRQLGAERQVLCVTHLPQVASQAHHQLRVQKRTDGQTTETRIEPLATEERIDEIARMLGGVAITEKTRRHADEMIHRAQAAD